MSKDFRAKQVRTNKIIGRGKPAISGHASELQLALMKSGSANFAGGVTDPVAHDAQAGWLAANHDTGRLSREIGRVGSDVWLLVDGGQTHRNQRSTGESVLFLGDVVVSGTLYAERQRINITTQSVIANEDHTLMLSGSVFVNENQGISVGKTAIINKDSYTEPRSGNITTTDSVFWAGDGEGSGSGAGLEDADMPNTPSPLLVIRTDLGVASSTDKKGRIGIGVDDPDAKLEIFGAAGSAAGTAQNQFKISHDATDYMAIKVAADGVTTFTTNDNDGTGANAVFNIDGALDINAATSAEIDAAGAIAIESSGGSISIGADDVAQPINIGTDGAREVTIGDASASNASGVTIRANTGGIDIDCQQATGDLQLDTAGGAIHIGHNAAAGNISIGTNATARTITVGNNTGATGLSFQAGTGGVQIASTGIGDIVINSDDVLLLDSDGLLEINSSAGAINIGNDAVAQAINVGTGAAARTITIGDDASTKVDINALDVEIDAGTNGFTVDSAGAIDIATSASNSNISITPHNTGTLTLGADANTKVDVNAATIELDAASKIVANAASTDADAVSIVSAGGVDITAAGDNGSVNISSTESSDFTLTSNADGEDLTIALAGSTNSSLILSSTGTGTDAIDIDASAGSILVGKSLADGQTLKIGKTGAVEMTFSPHGTASSEKWSLTNTSGTAADSIKLDSVAGGIDIDAAGQIDIDAGGQLFIEGTGDSRIRTNSSGNLDIQSAALLNHTGATGVNITATNNSVAITGNTEVDLTAAFVDINAGATGLDVDAGAGGIAVDTTGTLSLDSADTTNLTMTADSGSGKTLTIDAINSGAGTASISIGATSGTAINIGHSTSEVTIGDNLTVTGNLTVQGDTTTLNVATLEVEDPLIFLARNQTGAAALDAGLVIERGDNVNAALLWDESANRFAAITTNDTGGTAGDVTISGYVPVTAQEFLLEGPLNKIDLDTDVVVTAAEDITLTAGGGNVKPGSDNAIALGVSGTAFSDLFLGSGAVVNFDAGDVTLTHSSNHLAIEGGTTRVDKLEIDGSNDHIDVSTDMILTAAADITLSAGGGNVKPGADNTIALGVAGTSFSDLFLGSGAVVNFDGGDVTMTHSANQLTITGGTTRVDKIELESADHAIEMSGVTMQFSNDSNVYQFGSGASQVLKLQLDGNDGRLLTPFNDNIKISAYHTGLVTTDLIVFGNNDSTPTVRVDSDTKLEFRDAGIYIQSDSDANLKVASDGDIDLTASGDVNIPASVGLTFGAGTNKVEVDGSHNLSIVTANDMAFQTGGASGDQFLLRNGGDTTENTRVCVGDSSTYIERQGGSNNVNFTSNRPVTVSAGGALNLYGSAANFKTQAGTLPVFNVSRRYDGVSYQETVLLANHTNDIVFQTAPGGTATEIARFDTSESSLLMSGSNKTQFRETTNFIHSPSTNTLDIEAGSSDNGTINIGTDQASNINIGKVGTTTVIEGLSLGATISLSGDNCRLTFDGSGTDPYIERTAGSVLRFTDGSNTNVTLSDLASNAVDATAFTTIAGDRQVINTARRLALIGSGSVGGTHGDEIYGYNATTSPSDAMFFMSGSVSPVGTPGVKETPSDEARRAVFDSDMIVSGSVALRGIYSLDGDGDVTGYPSSWVVRVAQTSASKGVLSLTGDIEMNTSDAVIKAPSTGDLEFQTSGGQSLMVFDGPNNVVTIPSDSTSKLAFGANTRFISNPNGTSDIKIETTGNVDISGGNVVIGADADGADRSIVFGHGTLKTRMGIDDSQDLFVINTNQDFGARPTAVSGQYNDFAIDSSGNVTIANGNLIAAGGHVQGPTDGQLKLYSDTDVLINIDRDGDATNAKFKVQTNTNTTKFEVDEDGNTRAYGTMRIDGNQILASDGGTPIQWDTSDNVTIGNNLTIGNNIIRNSDSETTITLDADQRVGIGGVTPSHMLDVNGDIRVRGNDIRNSNGDATISMDGSQNVTTAADLTATGALIGASLNLNEGNITNVGSIGCDSIAADATSVGLDIRFNGSSSFNKITLTDDLSDALSIAESTNTYLKFVTTDSAEKIEVHKNFIPNGTVDLGSTTNRFANIYTNDLNLCNEGRGNDVDGTSGNWTIQEGEENLYVINNITGKRFKMMLQPVEDGE